MADVKGKLSETRGLLDAPATAVRAPALEERLRIVIEHLSEGLVLSDLDGQLLHWNPAALALHGFRDDEEWRRRLPEFLRIFELSDLDGNVLSYEQWPMPRLFRGETVRNLELRIRRLDSDWERIFMYGGALVEDAVGETLAFLTMTDVTHRWQAAEEARRHQAELEQRVAERTASLTEANEELDSFSYSISHDLRAPLRTIDGFSAVMLEDFGTVLPEDGQSHLHRIRDGALRMGRLIDDLLRFSRLSRQPLQGQPVEAGRQVHEALDELKTQMGGRAIEVSVGELHGCWGDPGLLKQVWLNLLSNAVKYTQRKAGARIEVSSSVGASGEVTYAVRDNGAGFDMRYARKLFRVFQRLHRPQDFEGTGVGLAIVQRIVRRHGGQVSAEAAPELGATFTFTLPPGPPAAALL